MTAHPPDPTRPRWSRLIDRCAAELDARRITVPQPFDLDEFVAGVAHRRGRPIRLTRIRQPAGEATVCGLCFARGGTDFVYYTETLSSLHRSHNAVHELAHLVLGHAAVAPLARTDPPGTGPAGPGAAVAGYSRAAEEEADAMAVVVLSGAARPSRRRLSSSAVRAGADRLSAALRP